VNRDYRVTKNADFQNAIHNGLRLGSSVVTIYYVSNSYDCPRFGISVSKKRGNAVVRNRVRRQIREIIAHNLERIPPHFDYIIVVKDGYLENSFKENSELILQSFTKITRNILNARINN